MKLLHTADWHAGRTLHGQSRTPEIRQVLREIAELAQLEAVDLILVAGDLFDSKYPTPDAEEAVYEFFMTTGQAGIPSVVIAGNHDSPVRLDAVGRLLRLADVHVVGEARVAGQGGVLELAVKGEKVRIAALPFVSERRIIKVAELLGSDPGAWRDRYRAGMRTLINNLTAGFSGDAVNLLMMHTTMEGATLANSEYTFHCTEAYTVSADLVPEGVNYLALGHIHNPQTVVGLAENQARYAGSIIQLDFGEEGDDKVVYLIEAAPRQSTKVHKYRLKGGKRLKHFRCQRAELERYLPEIARCDGWAKLSITMERLEPGLKDRLKADYPQLLIVEQSVPGSERERVRGVDHTMSLVEAYAQFYQEDRGEVLPDDLRAAFEALYSQAHETAGAAL
ncbi:MAG: exonuclease subunit SbcD [Truepera sp.]|nr:exonuclease subunit SbcD [Truepera sp.]